MSLPSPLTSNLKCPYTILAQASLTIGTDTANALRIAPKKPFPSPLVSFFGCPYTILAQAWLKVYSDVANI